MKHLRILVALILMVALCTAFVTVNAEDADRVQTRASELIVSTGIARTAMSDGRVRFTPSITAVRSIDKLGFSTILIQEYNGSRWMTVRTLTGKYAYNAPAHAYTAYYNATAGRQYRAFVEFYAKDGTVYDKNTMTSSSVTAK